MKFKALISDFDNTLIGPSNTLEPEVSAKIQEIQKRGYHFAIATGRPFTGIIETECNKHDIKGPQIVSSGAAIIDPGKRKALYSEYIPESQAEEMITKYHHQGFILLIQTEHKIFTSNNKVYPVFGDPDSFEDIKQVDYSRILQIDLSPVILKLDFKTAYEIKEEVMQEYPTITASIVHYGLGYGVNITSLKATKHTGVLEYMKLMNLKPEEVVGVGDGHNDYPLLSACGYRAAMGDAPQDVKSIADIILPPQSENGILELFDFLIQSS